MYQSDVFIEGMVGHYALDMLGRTLVHLKCLSWQAMEVSCT